MRESDEKLTRLLREARPECGATPGFAAAVWRRLEAAERAGGGSPEGWLERWVNFWLQPRWALAGAAALLIAGGVAGAVDGSLRGREMARDRYVSSVNPPHAR